MPDEPITPAAGDGTDPAANGGQAPAKPAQSFTQDDVNRIVAERVSREREKYADYKDLKNAASELEKLRAYQMSETEKAVAKAAAEAEQRGKSAALATSASRLARAEIRAAAAGRVDKEALDGFLEYADVTKFVGDDGEPDSKAIEAAVKKLAGPDRPADFDGGARSTAKSTDMNQLIRQKAGLG